MRKLSTSLELAEYGKVVVVSEANLSFCFFFEKTRKYDKRWNYIDSLDT